MTFKQKFWPLWVVFSSLVIACQSPNRSPQGNSEANVSTCGDLSKKMEAHFSKYDQIRTTWFRPIVNEQKPYSEDQWEDLVRTTPDCKLSTEELNTLRERQDEAARESQQSTVRNSPIQISQEQRADEVWLKNFCADLPKGGMLHEHANGTMNRETVDRLFLTTKPEIDMDYVLKSAKRPVVELFPSEMAFLEKLYAEKPKGPFTKFTSDEQKMFKDLYFLPREPFDHSFKRFSFPFFIFPLLRNSDEEQLLDFLKRVRKMGVRYVEVTKNPRFGAEAKASDQASLDKIPQLAERLEKASGVKIRWNYSFFRTEDPAKNGNRALDLLKTLEMSPKNEIVGVDLLADEEMFPALQAGQQAYAHVMAAFYGESPIKIKLHRTFHAGELGLDKNVRDAILMGAERVGHGVKLQTDPVTLEYARKMGLGVEVNPTSNLRLRVVKSLAEHPFLKFLRLGLRVSLSTDDEGVLETDMNQECERIIKGTDVSYLEMKEMALNGIRTAFLSEEEKVLLIERVTADFEDFEKKWK